MIMKKLLTLFAAAAALVACNKAQTTEPASTSREVRFTVSNLYTVSTKAAIGNGSQVAVWAGAPINANNVSMTVSMEAAATSGTLAPTVANTLLWAVGQTTAATNFLAVYPYESTRPLVGDTEAEKYIEYSIENTDASVAYANDFLAAAASQAPGTGDTPATVALAFKHPFVKLIYNINNTSDDFVASATISGIRRNGRVMFADATVATTGDAVAADAPVNLTVNGENSFMTIAMPETAAVNPTVKVTMVSGAVYTFTLAAPMALEAGKQYTATIAIAGTHGTEVSDRALAGTFTVTDWANVDAGAMTGGVTSDAGKWWYLEGNIDEVTGTADGNWTKHLPFRCIAATTWVVDFYYAATETDADHGIKIRYAADAADWSEAYGKEVVIDATYVKAEGAGDDYLVEGLSTSGNNMRINAPGKYRIKFYTDTHNFHIYKLD